jgi:hypothetical protein
MFRKSLYFTQLRWQELHELMFRMNATTPSLAIAHLIAEEQQRQKGAANARSNQTAAASSITQ